MTRNLLLKALGSLVLALPAFAQTGQITGQVSDPTGARIPGAAVYVTNSGTGLASAATTNVDGYYAVPFLAPGEYRVSVTKDGFKTASRSAINLDVSQIARIDFSLALGSQAEEVTVTSTSAPLVQTETAALGQVIKESSVADLPLNGRNFTQLTTLTPGAYTAATTSFVKGSTIVANGMRTSNTVFVINGANTTDQDFEGTPLLPAPDAIQEFKDRKS